MGKYTGSKKVILNVRWYVSESTHTGQNLG